jgi:nucleotide-binding universal stress UspA family protein
MATVLLATDGSELATAAITRAVAALGPDHRYLALAAVPPAFVPTASVSPMETHPTLVDPNLEAELEAEQRAEVADDLDALDAALAPDLEHLVEVGDPGPTICAVAEREAVDIVVVGSHGHGWLQRVLMGSVSTYVLHHSPCPVLVVRPEDESAD